MDVVPMLNTPPSAPRRASIAMGERGSRLPSLETRRSSCLRPAEYMAMSTADRRRPRSSIRESELESPGPEMETMKLAGPRRTATQALASKTMAVTSGSPKDLGLLRGYLRELRGHADGITSVCYVPDGTAVATGSYDHTAREWDTATGECLRIYEGHDGAVLGVCFSPCGAFLVTACEDRMLRLWERSTGDLTLSLEGHHRAVTSVDMSSCGQLAVSGSQDGSVRVWQLEQGGGARLLSGHTGAVLAVKVSPCGSLVSSAGADGMLILSTVAGGAPLHKIDAHAEDANAVCWSPCGSRIISGGADRCVAIWCSRTGALIRRLLGHGGWVTGCVWSPCGLAISSSSSDGVLRVWDAGSGLCVRDIVPPPAAAVAADAARCGGQTCQNAGDESGGDDNGNGCPTGIGGDSWATCCACDPSGGGRLASGGSDGMLRLWDPVGGASQRRYALGARSLSVHALCWAPSGGAFATASDDARVRVWDAASGVCIFELRGHGRRTAAVVYSPDGHRIATGGEDASVRVWNAATGGLLADFPAGRARSVHFLAWSRPDGKRLAISSSRDRSVWVVDASSGLQLLELAATTTPEAHVSAVSWSADGAWLATATTDLHVRVWDALTARNVACGSGGSFVDLMSHSGTVSWLAWSPTAAALASASNDSTARIWRPQSALLAAPTKAPRGSTSSSCAFVPRGSVCGGSNGNTNGLDGQLLRLVGHTDAVVVVAWDPCGRAIATGSLDRTVRVWNSTTAACFLVLPVATGASGAVGVTALTWLPDGGRLATASGEEPAVRCWTANFTLRGQPTGATLRQLLSRDVMAFPDERSRSYSHLLAALRTFPGSALEALPWGGTGGDHVSLLAHCIAAGLDTLTGLLLAGDGEPAEALVVSGSCGSPAGSAMADAASPHAFTHNPVAPGNKFATNCGDQQGVAAPVMAARDSGSPAPLHGTTATAVQLSQEPFKGLGEEWCRALCLWRNSEGHTALWYASQSNNARVGRLVAAVLRRAWTYAESDGGRQRWEHPLDRLPVEEVRRALIRFPRVAAALLRGAPLVPAYDTVLGPRAAALMAEDGNGWLCAAPLRSPEAFWCRRRGSDTAKSLPRRRRNGRYPGVASGSSDGKAKVSALLPSVEVTSDSGDMRPEEVSPTAALSPMPSWSPQGRGASPLLRHAQRGPASPISAVTAPSPLKSFPMMEAPPRKVGGAIKEQDAQAAAAMKAGVTVPVTAMMVPLRGVSSVALLDACVKNSQLLRSVDVFESEAIAAVTEHLWHVYARGSLLRSLVVFLVLLVLYKMLATRFAAWCEPTEGVEWLPWLAWGLQGLKLLLTTWFARRLYRQLGVSGRWSFMREPWNFVEALTLALLFLDVSLKVIVGVEHNAGTIVEAIAAIPLHLRLLYYMRPFRATGPMVNGMFSIAADIRFFLLFFLIVIAGFASAFKIATGAAASSPFHTEILALRSVFSFVVDGADLSQLDQLQSGPLLTVFWTALTILVTVVMLNVLIAIITDSHDRINALSLPTYRLEKAKVVLGEVFLLAPADRARLDSYLEANPWLHVLLPASSPAAAAAAGGAGGGSGDSGGGEQWSGRVQATVHQMGLRVDGAARELRRAMDTRSAAAEARAEARAVALNSRIGLLEARLAANSTGNSNPFEDSTSLQERVASVEEVLLRMSATLDRLADAARA